MIGWWATGQSWKIVADGSVQGQQAYRLQNNSAKNKCLEAKESAPGTNGQYDTYIRPCDTSPSEAQQWLIQSMPQQTSHYRIFSVLHKGKAMTPYAAPNVPNTGLVLKEPPTRGDVAYSWTIDKIY
ncbi:RICIN domain-containing protein [Actinomadura rubrisoli]|nr:RICIN domain-containing protein [Actinomadura rubrisoli]